MLVKSIMLTCVVSVLVGCTTDRASQPAAPLPLKVESELKADIDVNMNKILQGEASQTKLFGLLTLSGPTTFADGVFVSMPDGALSFLLGNSSDDIKAAAVYDAVYGKADIIVAPQWTVKYENYLIITKTTARVTGYAGTILSINGNVPSTNALKPLTSNFNKSLTSPRSLTSPKQSESRKTSVDPLGDTQEVIINTNSESGPRAKKGDVIIYQYVCSLENGKVIFDSRNQGDPRKRIAGGNDMPIGFSESLVGVRKGTHRQILLQPEKAYGSAGLPNSNIPPNATIMIEYFVEDVIPKD